MIKPKILRALYDQHEEYWRNERPKMRKLRLAYNCEYWNKRENYGQILIETTRAYEYVEGYIASLFTRSPAVVFKADVRGRGNPIKSQLMTNSFLDGIRTQLEDASRLALIYPCSFIKLVPNENPDPFKRISAVAINAWDVIVDTDAASWDDQRFTGHRYYLTLEDAKTKFGNKRFVSSPLVKYLDYIDGEQNRSYSANQNTTEETAPIFEYVEVVEMYDFRSDKLFVWSPDYADGEKFLYSGVVIEEGEGDTISKTKYDDIPFRSASDAPISPIVPLYYSRHPDMPLRGMSALNRVYDQIQETNIIRTYQANMVRRAARQWVVEQGVFDSDSMSKLAQGIDGEYIEVELSAGQTLSGSIIAVPHSPVPTELQQYVNQVNDDFQRGSVMAPFTRGEATKATATEVTALAAYSSSEVGRLARERDSMIEQLSSVYVSMMQLFLTEDADVIVLDGKVEILKGDDLDGDFKIYAQDMGSTPVSDSIKKQEFVQLLPTLQQLGVPNEKLLEQLIRNYDLPEDLMPEPISESEMQPPAMPEAPQPSMGGAPMNAMQEAQLGYSQPSPQNISRILPNA